MEQRHMMKLEATRKFFLWKEDSEEKNIFLWCGHSKRKKIVSESAMIQWFYQINLIVCTECDGQQGWKGDPMVSLKFVPRGNR